MVQIFDLPRSRSGVLGEAFGKGLSKVGENIGMQQKQSQLAKALFGEEGEQYAGLPVDQQLKLAKMQQDKQLEEASLQQKTEQQQQKNQLLQSLLGGGEPEGSSMEGGQGGQGVPGEEPMQPRATEGRGQTPGRRKKFSQQDILKIGIDNPQLARIIQADQEKTETQTQKKFQSERDYQSKRSLPFMKKLDENRSSLDEKDQALFLMKNAIGEGNLEFFSRDSFANFLGKYGEGLRTAKGAQLINAQKEFLLGNISRAGARPNMWIEQQISKMLAQIGRSDEANLTVIESLQSGQDLDRKKQEVSDQLIDQYEKELGYVPGNIASQVDKIVKPYAQNIQNRLAYRIRNIQENEMGENKLKRNLNKRVSQGTPLTLQVAGLLLSQEGSRDSAMKKAKKLGYTVPSLEEYRNYSE